MRRLTDGERAGDRVVLLFAETAGKAGRVPLAPSLLLQYWLAVSTQPGSYHLQVLVMLYLAHLAQPSKQGDPPLKGHIRAVVFLPF